MSCWKAGGRSPLLRVWPEQGGYRSLGGCAVIAGQRNCRLDEANSTSIARTVLTGSRFLSAREPGRVIRPVMEMSQGLSARILFLAQFAAPPLVLLLATSVGFVAETRAQNSIAAKKLIEFGWDEPDTAFLRKHIAQMETTPFDGTVFHVKYAGRDGRTGVFSWEPWSRRAFTEDDVRSAMDDLKATTFRRFRDNFLRFNTTPADIDWFDDFSAVVGNARLAGKIARAGKAKGILFDTEAYAQPLFNYQRQKFAPTKSWQEYAEQASRRGSELMKAFQHDFPGVKIFLTFGYGLPWERCMARGKALMDCDYGLLAPFLDGMLGAVRGSSRIIDGYEFAYYFKEPREFPEAYFTAKNVLQLIVSDPKKYLQVFSFSFGIWMDADWRERGWHVDDHARNFHSPEQFEAVVRKALEVADEYVWIYTETPRWWSEPEGNSTNLPDSYKASLSRARQTTP